jgi:phage shock protein C
MNNRPSGPNPHRLYRDRERGLLAGVCSGLAEYFGFNARALRLVTAISAIFFAPFVVTSYIVLAILLPSKPVEPQLDERQKQFWRGVSNAPADVFSTVRYRTRELERRIRRMEAIVTSREFDFDRELKGD